MKLTIGNHFFPHPVLGNKSDIDSSFVFELNRIKKTPTALVVSGNVSISNKTIHEMLKHESASCILHIESSLTGFRKHKRIGEWDTNISEFCVEFPLSDLRGNIDINLICISNVNKTDYHPDGLSFQYEDAEFEITKGSILAFAKQKSIFLPDDNTKSSGGCLFVLEPNKDESLKFNYGNEGGQNIAILVPKSVFGALDGILKSGDSYFNGILVNTFFLPCLVEALNIYKEDSSTYLWCKNLEESLNEQDIFIGPGTELEFDRRMEIAQKVLNNAFPLSDLIKKYGIS